MNGVVGADVAELRELATALDRAGERLVAIHGDLTRRTDSARYWLGPDAARFRERWRSSDALRLRDVAGALSAQADRVRRNADEQERASAAEGGGSGIAAGSRTTATQAPQGLSALYSMVRRGNGDGLRIQEIVGSDGVSRYVVYMDGTGSAGHEWLGNRLTWPTNVPKFFWRETDPYILQQMRSMIPRGSEVMLVGYSQGGIDAQNIAALGTGEFRVTDVVTFGAPTVAGAHPEQFGTNVLHVRAWGDPVPLAEFLETPIERQISSIVTDAYSAASQILGQPGRVDEYVGNPGHVALPGEIHEDSRTYQNVGGELDSTTDPRYRYFLDSQSRYEGGVLRDGELQGGGW